MLAFAVGCIVLRLVIILVCFLPLWLMLLLLLLLLYLWGSRVSPRCRFKALQLLTLLLLPLRNSTLLLSIQFILAKRRLPLLFLLKLLLATTLLIRITYIVRFFINCCIMFSTTLCAICPSNTPHQPWWAPASKKREVISPLILGMWML